MIVSRAERLREFFRRVEEAPTRSSASQARALIEVTLNAVEDELTEVPFNPATASTDGRMYPPQDDNQRLVRGRDDVVRFRNRQHNMFIGADGAIRIEDLEGTCLINKPDANGRTIEWGEPESRPTTSRR